MDNNENLPIPTDSYDETTCDLCRHVEACPDAHKTAHPCDAFIDWRDTWGRTST